MNIAFDLDGTLIDSKPGIVAGLRRALGGLGHSVPDDLSLDWAIGPPLASVMARLLAMFGDDRQDYAQALKAHYANGAPSDWQARFVTPYAAAHPWEDFAETWAHYLHIVDTLEMARAFGVQIHQSLDKTGGLTAEVDFDPYAARHIDQLIDTWFPLSIALNSLNRTMGQPDLYPFVLSQGAIGKLGFIHVLIRAAPSGHHERS